MIDVDNDVPNIKHDIRLDDIVISSPSDDRDGVLQYDFDKTIQEQNFQ